MNYLDWLLADTFPIFWQNISVIATLFGTVITVLIWCKTRRLYNLYNSKAEDTYIIEKLSLLYERYSEKIKTIKKEDFENKPILHHDFWEIIKEANGKAISFKNDKSPFNPYIQEFIEVTSTLSNIQKDSLTYTNVWEYYNHLTHLYQVVKSLADINSRKVSK
ncbi:hypothetical protein [Pasteurella sp. PK-2025]|uniref:hypothetical protein n=1 Tax=Pasteurella sp. PK-2025 TaxID=3413133 RepID=UPI003C78EC82